MSKRMHVAAYLESFNDSPGIQKFEDKAEIQNPDTAHIDVVIKALWVKAFLYCIIQTTIDLVRRKKYDKWLW